MAFTIRTTAAKLLQRRQLRAVQLRCFSASAARDAQWGFIGLGQMGYNMAKNLQKKLPPTDTLLVQDINSDATRRFVAEVAHGGAAVRIASSPAEAADGSVSFLPSPSTPPFPHSSFI